MKKLFFIIYLVVPFGFLFAQEEDTSCRYRNLMEDNWLLLRNQVRETKRYIDMPAYDQEGTNTCYAFAATQLVDYWRQSRGFMPDERIDLASPIYMAMIFKLSKGKKKGLEFGSLKSAVNAINKFGLCPKEVVEKDLKEFMGKQLSEFKATGESTGGQVESDVVFTQLTQGFIVQTSSFPGIDDPINIKFEDYLNWAKDPNRPSYIKNISAGILKKVYEALMPYFKKGDYVGFLQNVLKSCDQMKYKIRYLEQMPPPRLYNVENFKKAREEGLVKNWNEYRNFRNFKNGAMIKYLLNLSNAPAVGIRYCAGVIKNPGNIYFGEEGRLPNCIDHFSIIVGKREVNGECQYLLKNTWNRSDLCNKHQGCLFREVRDPKTNQTYLEEMGMWITEKEILNNLDSITYIYPETKDEREIEGHWRRIEEKFIQSGEMFIKSLKKIRSR